MNHKPSKKLVLTAAIVALAACPIALSIGMNPSGLPPKTSLNRVDGLVEWNKRDRTSTTFKITGYNEPFKYTSKGGQMDLVEKGLEQGKRLSVAVYFDPNNPSTPIGSSNKTFPVYELRVGQELVHSYESVDAAWRSDDSIAGLIGIAFGAIGLYLAYYSRRIS